MSPLSHLYFVSLYMLLEIWGKLCTLSNCIFIIGFIIGWKSGNTDSKCEAIFQRTPWSMVLLTFHGASHQSVVAAGKAGGANCSCVFSKASL